MKHKILIFDFDGTIADTHQFIIEISNRLSHEFKYKPILPHEIELLKDKTSQEIIRHLRVPIMKIPAILAKAKKEFYQGISLLQPIDGLKEILFRLKEEGNAMGILSSNSLENIGQFLKNHQLDIFDFVENTAKVWSKNTSLKRLIQENDFAIQEMLYIGDEIRDVIAAKRLGVKIAAVTWGYNSIDALKKHNPDFMVSSPEELFKLCSKNGTKTN